MRRVAAASVEERASSLKPVKVLTWDLPWTSVLESLRLVGLVIEEGTVHIGWVLAWVASGLSDLGLVHIRWSGASRLRTLVAKPAKHIDIEPVVHDEHDGSDSNKHDG